MVGRQLGIMSIIVPFWLVAAQSGWRNMLGVWPACLVTGLSFGATQFIVSNFHGPWLVGIVSAFVSMGSLVFLMMFWKPTLQCVGNEAEPAAKVTALVEELESSVAAAHVSNQRSTHPPSQNRFSEQPASGQQPQTNLSTDGPASPWRAWLPWILLSVFVFLWGLPAIKGFLNSIFAPNISVPWLDNHVQRMPPIVPNPTIEHVTFAFNALSATGTALLLAGVAAGLCLGLSPAGLLRLYCRTVWSVRISLLTIALMLALGFTTRYSGTDTTLGLALASTGWFFPFFSPLIGWLGVALTGSDTSSNVLFGNLQQVTAQRLNLPPVLTASSNSSGGVMGKMIDAQSIVVASVATGGHPKSPDAGTVLRSVFWHSLALAVLMGILVMLQAYVWHWMVPSGKP
jgi:lactate permease